MAAYVLQYVNLVFHVSEDINYMQCENNYVGEEIGTFLPHANMPPSVSFSDIKITPIPCVVLKTMEISSHRAVFINVFHHREIPRFPLDNPYMLLASARTFMHEAQSQQCCIFDIGVHSSLWIAACETKTIMDKVWIILNVFSQSVTSSDSLSLVFVIYSFSSYTSMYCMCVDSFPSYTYG